MNYFAKNIRYLRKKQNMSQEELANKLGYKSFTTIQKWETEDSEPTLSTLNKVARIFNTDLTTLVKVDLENNQLFEMPETIITVEEAIEFLFSQKIVAHDTGIDMNVLTDEEKIQFANRMLDYARFIYDDTKRNR